MPGQEAVSLDLASNHTGISALIVFAVAYALVIGEGHHRTIISAASVRCDAVN